MAGIVILAICVAIVIRACFWLQSGQLEDTNFRLPPGPWGFPIVGHLPFFGKNPAVTFMKWARIYGPIVHIKFGSIPAVVLNDAKMIKEAFKLDIFAGRPLLPNFLKSSDMKGILLVDGPRQTEQRKFVIQSFKNVGLTKSELEFRVKEEIVNFLSKIQTECRMGLDGRCKKFPIHHFFQFPVLNSIWVSVMGWRLSEDDPTLNNLTQLLDKAINTQRSALGIMCWYFPWVAHALAFLGKNETVNGLKTIYNFMGCQIETSRGTYVVNERKSLAHAYFDQVARAVNDCNSSFYKGQEQQFTMGDIFIGAIDTTSVSLDWLLLYMAREPHIQKKLQEEIDEVMELEIGGELRQPTVSDMPRMPYTEAVLQELLRISSISPVAVFHRATEDVIFRGYKIAKDTMIVANLYGIHHDPHIWPEPDSFQPERFLNGAKARNSNALKSAVLILPEEGSSGTNNIGKPAERMLPFGFGKRSCVGEGFARDQLFLITTHFFQKFNVSNTEEKPSLEPVFGLVLSPHPFKLVISERNT